MATLTEITKQIAEITKQNIINTFKLQGHSLTGKFESEIEYIISNIITSESIENKINTKNGLRIDFYMLNYGKYLEQGVPASKIPYISKKRGQGTGGTSKYIQGLIRYVNSRMGISSIKEATNVAFKIAHKHSKEGMPTKSSYIYSKNGSRTKFIENSNIEKDISKYVEDYADEFLSLIFKNLFK